MGRRTKDSGRDGVMVIDKPAGITSHDVVARCRRVFGQARAGHSGTLDPDATGVMLVGFGQGTKLLPYLTALGKTYTAEVVLGTETSTLDDSGDVVATYDMAGITLEQVRQAASRLVGPILQLPPMVSAVRVAGKRLHQYEREGIAVERTPRPVTVYRYDVVDEVSPGVFSVEVHCSSGTYVRTLAADVGTALGGGAHLRTLRRTAVGPFTHADAAPLDDDLAERPMLSLREALRGRAMAVVDADTVALIRNGRVLADEVFGDAVSDTAWGVCGPDEALVGVYERFRGGESKPAVVITR